MAPSTDVCDCCSKPFFGKQKYARCTDCSKRAHVKCLSADRDGTHHLASGVSDFRCKSCISPHADSRPNEDLDESAEGHVSPHAGGRPNGEFAGSAEAELAAAGPLLATEGDDLSPFSGDLLDDRLPADADPTSRLLHRLLTSALDGISFLTDQVAALREENRRLQSDLAYYGEDGSVYLVERMENLITCMCIPVSPAELENLLLSHHDEITEVAVVGLPHQEYGQVAAAFIALNKPHRLPENSIREMFLNTVLGFITEATNIERALHARASHYQRPPGFAALSPSSCSIPDIRDIIRDVVREEIKKFLPAAPQPASLSIAEVVREEVQRAFHPEAPASAAVPEEPSLTYAAIARRPAPAAQQYSTPPRRVLPEPQTFRRREGQPEFVRTEHPTPRKTDVWRTADRRPLCYHCGEADHIYRSCPYRRLGLRGFHPNDPRPRCRRRSLGLTLSGPANGVVRL
ncbi:hypothetical protein HPB47_026489 [Ixodes persulcatus]|uniref:Uncharacterized protein n=1 Tax=Ixodes persulcatus TaxID=34615 RepID=A0AC60PYL7_IXOPE|nr:hypothetical protein HPB47_026489 [Ixodes persulcatus]